MGLEVHEQALGISATISLVYSASPSQHITVKRPPPLESAFDFVPVTTVRERLEAIHKTNKQALDSLDFGEQYLLSQQTANREMIAQVYPLTHFYVAAYVFIEDETASIFLDAFELDWADSYFLDAVTRFDDARHALQPAIDKMLQSPKWKRCIQKALAFDTKEVERRLIQFLSQKKQKKLLSELSLIPDTRVQLLVDTLQSLVDKGGEHDQLLMRTLRMIATERGLIPSQLYIPHVNALNVTAEILGVLSSVYRGNYKRQGRQEEVVAVKVLKQAAIQGTDEKELHRAAMTWRQLRHENVLPFYGILNTTEPISGHTALVSPWMENGNLLQYLKVHSNADRIKIICGIAEGVKYLHTQSPIIVHGDLRAANILISDSGAPLVSDFELSLVMGSNSRAGWDSAGKAYWYAPEIHSLRLTSDAVFTTASDIYSLACTMLETFTLKHPFENIEGYGELLNTVVVQRKYPNRPTDAKLPDTLWRIMVNCWQFEPTDRPDIRKIFERLTTASTSGPATLPAELQKLMAISK